MNFTEKNKVLVLNKMSYPVQKQVSLHLYTHTLSQTPHHHRIDYSFCLWQGNENKNICLTFLSAYANHLVPKARGLMLGGSATQQVVMQNLLSNVVVSNAATFSLNATMNNLDSGEMIQNNSPIQLLSVSTLCRVCLFFTALSRFPLL